MFVVLKMIIDILVLFYLPDKKLWKLIQNKSKKH